MIRGKKCDINLQIIFYWDVTFDSQYILSLLLFVVKNINMFKPNTEVYTISTRDSSDLYLPSAHLTKVQRGLYHSAVGVFNCLPQFNLFHPFYNKLYRIHQYFL
jgi:hypothetical protein